LDAAAAAARFSGDASGWETLGEEGKAGEGRRSSFLEHARGRRRARRRKARGGERQAAGGEGE